MRILVFEYITGGGLVSEELPAGLAAEGEQMLQALVADLSACDGVELRVFRDARLAPLDAAITQIRMYPIDDIQQRWISALAEVDAVWLIAPETDRILFNLTDQAQRAGKLLLGSGAGAVHVCGQKSLTLNRLRAAGIPTVTSWAAADAPQTPGPWIAKPDDGVGCDGLLRIDNAEALAQLAGNYIVQPCLAGDSLSFSMLCLGKRCELISVNRQLLEPAGSGLKLTAIEVGVLPHLHAQLQPMADTILQDMPALFGYVGVDFILTESGPVILEVNPRLTTSYASLRQKFGRNLAADVVHYCRQQAAT